MTWKADRYPPWKEWADDVNPDLPPPDVAAEVSFLSAAEGGRRTGVRTGYRPQFFYDEHDWDAIQVYATHELVLPGQTIAAWLWFLSPEAHQGNLHTGKTFLLREGRQVVARGRITELISLSQQ